MLNYGRVVSYLQGMSEKGSWNQNEFAEPGLGFACLRLSNLGS